LPVPEPDRERLRAIRRGEVPLADVVVNIAAAECELERLRASDSVADQPDRKWVDDWLHRSHVAYWAETP
jgi:hypothetical protein